MRQSFGERGRSRALALAVVVGLAAAVPAAASPQAEDQHDSSFLGDLLARVRSALDEAAASRAPQPPSPVPVVWRPRKLASFNFSAPLLGLEAADLDGDGGDELVALTADEVAVLDFGDKPRAVARAPLPSRPALVRSRDPVGSISVEVGDDAAIVVARSSEQAVGARYRFAAGTIEAVADAPGYPLCRGVSAELAQGRNFFEGATLVWSRGGEPPPVAKSFHAAECRGHVGPAGYPIETFAVVDTNRALRVVCAHRGEACAAEVLAADSVTAAGVAFEIADVDRDGKLEVIATRGQAPGKRDRVRVFAVVDGVKKMVFDHWFQGGVVALSAADINGDGSLEVIAAVRLLGANRINLWTLNRTR